MSRSMPWSLLLAWAALSGFVNTHQRHAQHFKGSSKTLQFALDSSTVFGTLIGLGLLIYYFTQVA